MQSSPHPFSSPDLYPPFFNIRADENGRNDARFADLGELQHYQEDAVDLSRSSLYNEIKSGNAAAAVFSNNGLQFRQHHMNFGSSIDMSSIGTGVDTGQQFLMQHHKVVAAGGGSGGGGGGGVMGKGHFENWGESAIADNSQQTDTSTDIDTDDKNQFNGAQNGGQVVVDSTEGSMGKIGDQKILRRLAQNREAARKSRLRKKAYVQQLENSRLKLTQLEHELKRARQQGMFIAGGVSGDQSSLVGGNGALAFDLEYARWLDDHQRLINDVRSAVNAHLPDNELRLLVEAVMSHYDEKFRLKSIAAKSDVFHMLSGMWKSPAERCFMWIGGFRSSELLKILGNHLEPLTDQQLMGICNLQQSSQQAEDALSQGMEALQQSLVDTLSVGFTSSGNVADYMGQMAIAMGKLATLENFLHQADLLRQQTLQQLHRILTTRQAARALLVISDYMSRLRALSSLWLARPKD
ncbi:putative transcription factor bZIP family [Helianthus debilis subsp. tardiflorus]